MIIITAKIINKRQSATNIKYDILYCDTRNCNHCILRSTENKYTKFKGKLCIKHNSHYHMDVM